MPHRADVVAPWVLAGLLAGMGACHKGSSSAPPPSAEQSTNDAVPHPVGWHRPHAVDGSLSAIWFNADRTDGWASARGGLYRFEGQTWRRDEAASEAAGGRMGSLWIRDDGKEGWALGAEDRLLHLEDGRWHKAEVPNRKAPEVLPIADAWVRDDGKEGWAVGGKFMFGSIYRLTDGAWHYVDNPTRELWSVWVSPDGRQGWASGIEGALLRLESDRWVLDEASKGLTTGHIAAMDVADDGSTGWAMTLHRNKAGFIDVLRLVDGHWVLDEDHSRRFPSAMASMTLAADGRTGWASGADGQVLRLKDGRWSKDEEAGAMLSGIVFLPWASDDGQEVVADANGQLVERRNGGWQVQDQWGAANGDRVLDAWVSPDGAEGWAVSTGGILALEGGRWRMAEHQPEFPEKDFASDYFSRLWVSPDGSDGWAMGWNIRARLVDGSWQPQPLGDENLGLSGCIWMQPDGAAGWAFFDTWLVRFAQGRWEPTARPDPDNKTRPSDIWLDPSQEYGWGVAANGYVLAFDGTRWESRGPQFETGFEALHIERGGNDGWAVGFDGVVVRLHEGKWHLDDEASALTDKTLYDVWVSNDGTRGFIVGEGGIILRLHDGRWVHDEEASAQTVKGLDVIVMNADETEGWALGWGRLHFTAP